MSHSLPYIRAHIRETTEKDSNIGWFLKHFFAGFEPETVIDYKEIVHSLTENEFSSLLHDFNHSQANFRLKMSRIFEGELAYDIQIFDSSGEVRIVLWRFNGV